MNQLKQPVPPTDMVVYVPDAYTEEDKVLATCLYTGSDPKKASEVYQESHPEYGHMVIWFKMEKMAAYRACPDPSIVLEEVYGDY